jgi:sucrose phosphorylase
MTTKEPDVYDVYQRLGSILKEIYGDDLGGSHTTLFAELIEKTSIPPKTHKVSEQDVVLIAYGDHIAEEGKSPLQTLRTFSKTHFDGLLNSIHVLPHYPSTSDDGFAVSDYMSVDPELGSWEDMDQLGKDFHVMFDAVFNHTSVSHEWFQKFLAGDPKYKDYYIALDKDTDVSTVTRPRAHPLLTAFETPTGTKHVWTTFSTDQVDLNFASPDVLYDILVTLLEYVKHGADLIRFDAVAYVWKELGTNSIHHAKAHAIVKCMREVLRLTAPWVLLITETNVPHEENISYFGNGHDEAQLVYNFALPPLMLHSIQTGDTTTLTKWASTLKTPSDETYFYNFIASHDGVGVRPVTGILQDEEIEAMCVRTLARGGRLGMKTNPDGSEGVYEMNISYFNAVADPEAPRNIQVDQFIISQAIMLSMQGIPGIYMHSLLGSTNWQEGVEQTGRNRTINREKLQVEKVERELQDPKSLRKQIFDRYSHLLKIRTGESAFSPLAFQTVRDYGPHVFAVERVSQDKKERILAVHNVTAEPVPITLDAELHDLISDQEYTKTITLSAYQTVWLKG